jgi:hypothetical protein
MTEVRTDVADITTAIVPNASGASTRVSSMFRPNRDACSKKLPDPSQTPPRNTFAFKVSPPNIDGMNCFIFW